MQHERKLIVGTLFGNWLSWSTTSTSFKVEEETNLCTVETYLPYFSDDFSWVPVGSGAIQIEVRVDTSTRLKQHLDSIKGTHLNYSFSETTDGEGNDIINIGAAQAAFYEVERIFLADWSILYYSSKIPSGIGAHAMTPVVGGKGSLVAASQYYCDTYGHGETDLNFARDLIKEACKLPAYREMKEKGIEKYGTLVKSCYDRLEE